MKVELKAEAMAARMVLRSVLMMVLRLDRVKECKMVLWKVQL